MKQMMKKLMVLAMVVLMSVSAAFAFERKGGYPTYHYDPSPEFVLAMPSVIDILSQEGLSPEDVTLEWASEGPLERAFNNTKLVESTKKMAEEYADEHTGEGYEQFVIGWFGEGVPEKKQYLILWVLNWPDGLKAYPFFYRININK